MSRVTHNGYDNESIMHLALPTGIQSCPSYMQLMSVWVSILGDVNGECSKTNYWKVHTSDICVLLVHSVIVIIHFPRVPFATETKTKNGKICPIPEHKKDMTSNSELRRFFAYRIRKSESPYTRKSAE